MSYNLPLNILMENERISRTELYLTIAELISLRGTCARGRNGAVITRDYRIISTGYNGSIMRDLSCAELECDITKKCVHAVHAEANAIAAAAKFGINIEGSTIYTTSAPCYECAKLIIQAGIKVVLYTKEYLTDTLGIPLLKQHQIEVYQHHIN